MWLLWNSFLFGAVVGILNDVFRLSRVMLGVRYSGKSFDRLYTLSLPILKRPLGEIRGGKAKQGLLQAVMLLEDMALFAFAAGGTVVLNYYFNNGRFRFYTVVALVLGFVLYYFTVGKLVALLSEMIVFFLRAILGVLFASIFRPIAIFFVFLEKIIKKLGINIEKTIANRRKRVYNKSKVKRTMECSREGFLDPSVLKKT